MASAAEMMNRLMRLERAAPAGVAVSNLYGATEIRQYQIGFPVELTSTWDASTGYSWKQLGLDGVSVTDPDVQRTGDMAVPIDGNTALTSGTVGWLEPDPGAAGWLFITGSTSSSGGGGGDAHWLAPVDYAATGPVTLATSLENGDTLDGGTLATGMSILLPYQSTDSENGVYTVNASGAPTRRSDADTSAKLHGAVVPVRFGDTLARSVWVCTAPLQPSSFSGQIWERKGNAVYAVPLASVGSTNPLPMRTGADGPLTAALDDSPGYYTSTGFTNGSNGTYESSGLGYSAYSLSAEFGTADKTAAGLNNDGIDQAAGFVVGPLTGLVIGATSASPLVARIISDGTDWTFAELAARTKSGSYSVTRFQFLGSATRVRADGGSATFDADGGFLVGGTAGLTGTLGPGAAATGGIITSLGSGSFVGTASDNAFTGENSFADTTTFTGSLLSQSSGTFTPGSAATVPLTVKGAASQSSYLQRNEDSTGALLGGFDDDGVYRGPADFGEWTSPPPPPPPPPPPVSPPIPPPP